MIFLTPYIIKQPMDLAKMSSDERGRLEVTHSAFSGERTLIVILTVCRRRTRLRMIRRINPRQRPMTSANNTIIDDEPPQFARLWHSWRVALGSPDRLAID